MFYKFFLCVIIFVGFSTLSFAQSNLEIEGLVTDSASAALISANVMLVHGTDTLRTVTNSEGRFHFNSTQQSDLLLIITHLGYKEYAYSLSSKNEGEKIDLGKIALTIDNKRLKEVTVKGKAQPVVFKRDTTEYDVASYGVDSSAMVIELLKKLPGIDVDRDGNILSQGQKVTKLRVNGRDFFTGNVTEFIKQLPTGIFAKVQIVNDYGDMAAFTGLKNGEPIRQLNLVTRPGMDNGAFGTAEVSAGTNKYIQAGVNGNFWKKGKQISAGTNYGNMRGVAGNNISKGINASYNDQFGEKLRFGSNYSFNSGGYSYKNESYAETVNSLGIIKDLTNTANISSNKTHRVGLDATFMPNAQTYATVSANFSVNTNIDTAFTNSQQSGVIKQGLISNSADNSRAPNGYLNISLSKSFDKKQRLFVVGFNYSNSTTTKRSVINRLISYYDANGKFAKDSVYNNLLLNTTRAEKIGGNFVFSQAINKKSNVDINYNYALSRQHNVLSTLVDVMPVGYLPIDSLSSDFHSSIAVQRISLNYRFTSNTFYMTAGLGGTQNMLSDLSTDKVSEIKQTTYNFSPNFSADYNPSTASSFNFRYDGNSQSPSINQLQPTLNTRDLQNVVIGNPNLKPSFNHQASVGIRRFLAKSEQTFFWGLNGSVIQNAIITNTVIIRDTLNTYKQRTSYLNENGTYSVGSNYNWGKPIKIGKTSLNASYSGSFSYGRQVVYADSKKAFNNVTSFSQNAGIGGGYKALNLQGNFSYSQSNNNYTVGQGLSNHVGTYGFSLNGSYSYKNVFADFSANKSITKGYANVNSNNPFVINASVGRGFLKNQRLNIRLSASDILNQSSHFYQVVSGNTVTNNRNNYITRYFTLTVRYSVSKFGNM